MVRRTSWCQKGRGASVVLEPVVVFLLDIRSRIESIELGLTLLLDVSEHFAVPIELNFRNGCHVRPVVDRVGAQDQEEVGKFGHRDTPIRLRIVFPRL